MAPAAAKFAVLVKKWRTNLPGFGVSPTSKVIETEARERRSKYPKGYSDRLLAKNKIMYEVCVRYLIKVKNLRAIIKN